MPKPIDVFRNSSEYMNFITASSDDAFEDQHFDRKEVPLPVPGASQVTKAQLKRFIDEQIIPAISAFANENREGGLLVIGVSKTGEVKGIDHLDEQQKNNLTAFERRLRNESASTQTVICQDNKNLPKNILLIYIPHSERSICETLDFPPKAWIRRGSQKIPIDDNQRDRLKREKGIVDFGRTPCCSFDKRDIDIAVLKQFRNSRTEEPYQRSDEELLYDIGAIERQGSGHAFTNAGLLFFSVNAQRQFSWAAIRLLRFEVEQADARSRGLPTYDKTFSGPVPQQIRKIRTILQDSGFFKNYQKRNSNGGFIDDPEYPPLVIDEAIINAIAHRDYGIRLPVECIAYKDAFVIENPGKIRQRGEDVPEEFSLQETSLTSMPGNPMLMEWLRIMRDENGKAYVQALSEGTRRMGREMENAHLPPPHYKTGFTRTELVLLNNAAEREKLLRTLALEETATEYTNLFPLSVIADSGANDATRLLREKRKEIIRFMQDALLAKGWFVDQIKYGRIITHQKHACLPLSNEAQRIVRFYPAYVLQLREYSEKFYLCIDYTLQIKNVLRLREAMQRTSGLLVRTGVANLDGWRRCKIIDADIESANVFCFDTESEERIPSDKIIPNMSVDMIKMMLRKAKVRIDLDKEIKRHSLLFGTGAVRLRQEKTLRTAKMLSRTVFPVLLSEDWKVYLDEKPAVFKRYEKHMPFGVQTLPEPCVEFNHQRKTPDIREGITNFGSYGNAVKQIEIVPLCAVTSEKNMAFLIQRLKGGKYRYAGSERTFHTRFTYNTIITSNSPGDIPAQCERLLKEHPDWAGNENLSRLFLVHAPENDYSRDDENAPYYRVKRLLLEHGIPCQMVNTPTLANPDWKDLNLALNIVAKCGVVPWVLPNKIADADFIIGLSYTQSKRGELQRLMGYATVFDEFGRWRFYAGNTDVFSYEERTRYFAALTAQTLERLPSLSETPRVCFHYSAKFSREDREAILGTARKIRPKGTYSFVSINQHHNIRLYDARPETDGSLSRGYYVPTGSRQLLLSTTGYNPYRKSLGTPKPLEITVWTTGADGVPVLKPDLKSLANQILCLTKLNWASTNAICGEPVTVKFAGDIAYLTSAFLRQSKNFKLHPVLEKTPWFI
ncbi:MAG: transcriptional regulator [Gammaproteobacteria bacterium]|nr:transcriptional regulator [Gammaproteobacteria bacterium]